MFGDQHTMYAQHMMSEVIIALRPALLNTELDAAIA